MRRIAEIAGAPARRAEARVCGGRDRPSRVSEAAAWNLERGVSEREDAAGGRGGRRREPGRGAGHSGPPRHAPAAHPLPVWHSRLLRAPAASL